MLHDSVFSKQAQDERRQIPRLVCDHELVVAWHHDMDDVIRYAVTDRSEQGFRIQTTSPLIKGMTGSAIKLLPFGEMINRPCSVRWVSPPAANGIIDVGLWLL